MGRARYVVEAVVLEGRNVTELARTHGVSRFWIYKLLARYKEGGYPALDLVPDGPSPAPIKPLRRLRPRSSGFAGS